MHILIAPNAFKHSLSATDAAEAIQEGLRQSKASHTSECFPVGDGGNGTGHLIVKRCNGTLVPVAVHDPLGRPMEATFGLIDGGETAVVEMADASGIHLLKPGELDPLRATSFGTGELILAALDKGVKKIIVGMGGSATVDGATGILSALGVRFLQAGGQELDVLPGALSSLTTVDLSGLDRRILDCELVVLCDVDNMLLGEQGSAAVFGPQKGATASVVRELDRGLSVLSAVAAQQLSKDMAAVKYGGTAGGAAAGLYAFVNAKLVNGIDHFLELTNFDAALDRSDLVITGEGSLDAQTLHGKGPFGVAYRAKRKGLPVVGIAGKVPLERNLALIEYFNVLLPLGHEPLDLDRALAYTKANLIRTGESLGNLLVLLNHH
jgi:glycerate kinase